MYRIYLNSAPLHHPNLDVEGRVVLNPALDEAVNTQGNLAFTVPASNPEWANVTPRTAYITVKDDSGQIWRGRVISTEKAWNNAKSVQCEGELAFLKDSQFRPFVFRGTPGDLLAAIIYDHNQQVDAERQFTLGTVTVTDPNDYILRSSKSAKSSWDALMDALVESSLGGYIRARTVGDVHYIDYLADFEDEAAQTVKFAENLLDLVQTENASEIATCLIPYGARFEDDDPNHEDEPQAGTWDGNRLTIRAVNNGLDYVENAAGVERWGRVFASETWDDITIPANLKTAAEQQLAALVASQITLEVNAADLSLIDGEIPPISVGQYVRTISGPHDLNTRLLCRQKHTAMTAPDQTTLTLGAGIKTLTDLYKVE